MRRYSEPVEAPPLWKMQRWSKVHISYCSTTLDLFPGPRSASHHWARAGNEASISIRPLSLIGEGGWGPRYELLPAVLYLTHRYPPIWRPSVQRTCAQLPSITILRMPPPELECLDMASTKLPSPSFISLFHVHILHLYTVKSTQIRYSILSQTQEIVKLKIQVIQWASNKTEIDLNKI